MKEDVETALLKAIKNLAENATRSSSYVENMQTSQAVLNYSHAYAALKNTAK